MRKSLSRPVHGRARGQFWTADGRFPVAVSVVQTAGWSSPDSEDCGGASMIGVSARSWALSCAVRPVPPHLAWPDLVSSRVVSSQTLLVGCGERRDVCG